MCDRKKYEKLEQKIFDNYIRLARFREIPDEDMHKMYDCAVRVYDDMVPGKNFSSMDEYYADKFEYLHTVMNSYIQVKSKLLEDRK